MPIRRTSNQSSQDTGFYNPEVYSDVGSRRIFEFDADALVYINAVEAADGEALEFNVKTAYNAFVVGCKSDGIWSAIKASCIMAGARTLSGALVPLVGVAPTNNNFVSGDYSRTTGLVGSGTKYLDSNRAGNADPRNSKHLAVYATSTNDVVAGNRSTVTGATYIDNAGVGFRCRIHTTTATNDQTLAASVGLYGGSRSGSSTGSLRAYGNVYSITTSSQLPQSDTIFVFARRNSSTGVAEAFATGSITFYSIGENLDLALLDNRVTVLMSGIQNAIP